MSSNIKKVGVWAAIALVFATAVIILNQPEPKTFKSIQIGSLMLHMA